MLKFCVRVDFFPLFLGGVKGGLHAAFWQSYFVLFNFLTNLLELIKIIRKGISQGNNGDVDFLRFWHFFSKQSRKKI